MPAPLNKYARVLTRPGLILGALAAAAFLDLRNRKPPAARPRAPPRWRVLDGSYAASLTVAIIALSPFIVVTTAYAMFSQQVQKELGTSQTALSIISGLSTAGYAWGALLGGDLVQRFRQRRLFFVCQFLFAVGCALAALAHGPALYAAGRVLSGVATGLLLVIALPPVIQRFPAAKLPFTVVFVNIGFFGAVCIGPLLGGWVAAGDAWRWFFAALGAIGIANLLLALVTLPDQAPFNPGLPFDFTALLLGFGAVVLPFWASGELSGHGFASAYFIAPLSAGTICFVALLLVEFRKQTPLSPVKLMWNTQSVVGTLVAMIAGGVFVSLLELAERFHMQVLHQSPLHTGILFWPLAAGVLVTAALFGAMLRGRGIPLLIVAGMALLIIAGALLLKDLTMAAAVLLGLGAGATVSPGLYLAGFPLSAQIIGRVFALVELVRSLADYLMAPVMVQIARESSASALDAHGVHFGLWVTMMVVIGFTVLGTALYLLGRTGLQRPDLERWLGNEGPAIRPTPLFAPLRRVA